MKADLEVLNMRLLITLLKSDLNIKFLIILKVVRLFPV
jgi:hypothetical protein